MNGIEKITAATTQGDSLFSNHDNSSTLRNNTKSAESTADNKQKGNAESSTIITLSATAPEEIERQVEEVKKTDYTLQMSGLPLFGGRLISIETMPNGEQVILDALSGRRLTSQELDNLSSPPRQDDDGIALENIATAGPPGDIQQS